MPSYCINPLCEQRQNSDDAEICLSCGTSLLINNRIRLVKPLRELTENPFIYYEIFEVNDAGTKWNPVRKQRVMKVMKWSSPELVQLIEQESRALRLIQHPNIPESTLDDFFTFVPNNNPLTLRCLVMDKFEGQNLEEWIKSHERISQSLALEWLRQLVEILDVVHHTEFFHRDIKPANIILQPNGQLALIDFGTARRITDTYLAKVSASGGTDTRVGKYEITSVVSHYYTPLEQIHGKAVPQSDFYALGRTFIRLVTGIPLRRLSIDKKTGRLIWRDKAPQIDKPFADLLDDLMALFPGQRPQTTQVISERLQDLPFKLKISRVINSQIFRYLSIGLLLLIIIGGYQRGNIALSSYFFYKARQSDEPHLTKKYYDLAVKYNPRNVIAYSNLAVACQEIQDIKCMNDSYEKVFQLQPHNWIAHYNLGHFYDDEGEDELAEKEYKLAIQYSNNQAINAVSNLARLKIIQEKYSEAVTLALEGLKRTDYPEWQAGLYKNLGWARFKQQRYAEAKEYLLKSVKLDSERIDAYCLLAQTQEALGELKYTQDYWEICLMANNANSAVPEVQQWRQSVLQRLFRKN